MSKNFLQLNLQVQFQNNRYKSLLRKLQTFVRYCATVGIHTAQGKQKVIRRYNSGGKNKQAGVSHRMTIAKLAYQNEFGAQITIPTKYKNSTKTRSKTKHTLRSKITHSVSTTRSVMRGMKEQGYVIVDKAGKWVAYFPPGKVITIPSRSFIRKIVNKPDNSLSLYAQMVLQRTFVVNGLRARDAMLKIAKGVEHKMKNNVHNGAPNHWITKRAKGSGTPLLDEQDRILNAIKYKIYKDVKNSEAKGYKDLSKQMVKQLDELLKSADKIVDKGLISSKESFKSFTYKGVNPHFGL